MKYFAIFFMFAFYGCSAAQNFDNGKDSSIFEAVGQFVPYFKAAMALWQGYQKLDGILHPKSEYNPSQKIALLATKIDEISKDMKYYHKDISTTLTEIDKNSELTKKMSLFINKVNDIESVFEDLLTKFEIENFTYEDVEETIRRILDKEELSINLSKMIKYLTEMRDDDVTVFQLLVDPDLKAKQVCASKASVQQKMYGLFQTAHDTQVKGLLMLIFAYQADIRKSKTGRDHGIASALSKYFAHTKDLTDLFTTSFAVAPRDLWMCDPQQPVEGTTYERFGRAFQKYLFNVKNAEPPGVSAKKDNCPARCEGIPQQLYEVTNTERLASWEPKTKLTTAKILSDSEYDFDERPVHPTLVAVYSTDKERAHKYMHEDVDSNRCYGGILKNCKTIEQSELEVCRADSGQVERYSYVKVGDSTYGSKDSCRKGAEKISRPVPNFLEKLVVTPCTYCMCTCDFGDGEKVTSFEAFQRRDTDRYVDLRPVTADKGYVVTGVRLRKIDQTHTFHLEIKQAKLLANGRVSKAEWKNTTSYYPREIKRSSSSKSPVIQINNDFHQIAYNNTVVYLDNTMSTSDEQVVTGVSFEAHSHNGDGRVYLGLGVRFSKFEFASGKISTEYEWLPEPPPSIENRTQLKVDDLELPTQYNRENKVITDESRYVVLANSGLEHDIGQNVLPFVDIQPVETNPPVPLAGVGLYHRGVEHSGGYLGLKASILNLKRYLPDTTFLIGQRQELLDSINLNRSHK